ncbi:MAG: phosphatidate cytidylyltransferase [Blautia sp.]|nr:phosphatidate cytidylyltransferase [Blautia sp.]MCM1201221.1 phosphatidate cytidylyltransferase [Bacteroides fragilis]
MFRTRLLSGIVLVVIAAGTIIAGGWVLAAVLCVISMTAYRELAKATGVHDGTGTVNALEVTGFAMIVFYYAGMHAGLLRMEADDRSAIYRIFMSAVVIALLVFMFVYVFSFPRFQAGQVMAAFFELLYAPMLLSFLYIIREGWEQGALLTALVFLCSWGSDTCAYAVGVLFGRHKMTPKLSPKKSVEGGIGGVAGAALLFGLYTYYVVDPASSEQLRVGLVPAMCLGAVGALLSMVGDLAASAIKRDHEIKDYGKLIPGHGGIMDRFDSVIIAAPFIFFGLTLITG